MDNFSVWSSGATGTPSTWRHKRNPVDATVQTEKLSYTEAGNQARVSRGVEAQTTAAPPPPDCNFLKEPYPPSLYAFFAKVTDPMCEALEENLNPIYGLSAAMAALIGGEDASKDEDADTDKTSAHTARKLYELRSPAAGEGRLLTGTAVAWNCQGAQVALAYSEPSHERWCVHQGLISVWSIGRLRNASVIPGAPQPAPHNEVQLPACVTALDFHPANPSVLVAGLHSGEVVLIDLHASGSVGKGARATSGVRRGSLAGAGAAGQFEEDEGTTTPEGVFYIGNRFLHATQVVSVKWLSFPAGATLPRGRRQSSSFNSSPDQHMILTASKDGLIGLWSVNRTYNRLFLEKRIVILPRNLPEEGGIAHRARLAVNIKELGVTALASAGRLDPGIVTVATFGDFLFQADVAAEDELDPLLELDGGQNSKVADVVLVNGAPTYLRKGRGYVNALDYSPYHQNLVLASTQQGYVELVNTLKPGKPVLDWIAPEPGAQIASVAWGGRPMAMGVAWGRTVSVYDLMQDDVVPAVELEHAHEVQALAFNKKELNLLAVVDAAGWLHIGRLPEVFKEAKAGAGEAEMDALIKLGEI